MSIAINFCFVDSVSVVTSPKLNGVTDTISQRPVNDIKIIYILIISYPSVSSNLDGSRVIRHKKGITNLINFLAVHKDQVTMHFQILFYEPLGVKWKKKTNPNFRPFISFTIAFVQTRPVARGAPGAGAPPPGKSGSTAPCPWE